MRLIIAGGRDFTNYTYAEQVITHMTSRTAGTIEIVNGLARGADALGGQYAKAHNWPCKEFPANWDLHGKSAGYKRNAEMAKYATHLIAFWDGKSRGTKHMIDLATSKGLVVKVVKI